MTKWELSRYLIDAKKSIDSVIFISDNIKALANIDVRNKVQSKRDYFFINCCAVLDKALPNQKKALCKSDDTVHALYYERDKHAAHKDDTYIPKQYDSFGDMITDMKKQLAHVKDLCKTSLPEILTLDFVSHDRELFRLVNGLTAKVEEKISERKYPFRQSPQNTQQGMVFKAFNDTEDIREISQSDRCRYAVPLDNGINYNEGLQNRQDFCIRVNVFYGMDTWCEVNQEALSKMKELRECGVIDQYGVFEPEALMNPAIFEKVNIILGKEVLTND
ncbi:MAG: hypothetical protein FWG40_12150 [Peptococcaceae bacterium]|nr:hypothetical protein [Peptococcaceae bacterium]